MSVLIKGMKMPRDCEECRFSEVIDGLGCMATHYLILRRHGQEKPNWCPLVEVPPHGRLIDAGALERDIEQYHLSEGMFQHWVQAQNTVIEAEEDKPRNNKRDTFSK